MTPISVALKASIGIENVKKVMVTKDTLSEIIKNAVAEGIAEGNSRTIHAMNDARDGMNDARDGMNDARGRLDASVTTYLMHMKHLDENK